MQCTDGNISDKQLFSKISSLSMVHLIPNTLQYSLDYIMRQTTQNAQHGIPWSLFSQLEDLDYADDITLVSTTANHLQNNAQLLTENVNCASDQSEKY